MPNVGSARDERDSSQAKPFSAFCRRPLVGYNLSAGGRVYIHLALVSYERIWAHEPQSPLSELIEVRAKDIPGLLVDQGFLRNRTCAASNAWTSTPGLTITSEPVSARVS